MPTAGLAGAGPLSVACSASTAGSGVGAGAGSGSPDGVGALVVAGSTSAESSFLRRENIAIRPAYVAAPHP
ncbi:hypothetical protein Microterr_05220 [Microbacterium terricola]|uniref:Uncharacterized protein n=1 Tax=Microbacterium terricola TaxID=344163 RepID=A0ABM8DW81_9MICO|nr:hypothetical protein Microterr_05220 [Microbacterium terricola]